MKREKREIQHQKYIPHGRQRRKETLIRDLKGYWKAACLLVFYTIMVNLIFHHFCPMVIFTGIPCPGCGMTRALFEILQFDFADAWEMHPFVYGWVVLGIAFGVRRYGMGREIRSLQKYAVILLAAMMIFYVYRMIRFFPNQEPMTYEPNNLLRVTWEEMRQKIQVGWFF